MEDGLVFKIKLGKNILDYTDENLNKLPNKTKKFIEKEYNKARLELSNERLAKLQAFRIKFQPILDEDIKQTSFGNRLHTKQGICCLLVYHHRYTLFSLDYLKDYVNIKDKQLFEEFPDINAPLRNLDKFVSKVLRSNLIYKYTNVYESGKMLIITDYDKEGSYLVFVFKNRQVDLEYFHYRNDEELYKRLNLNLADVQEIEYMRGFFRISKNGNNTFHPSPNGDKVLLKIKTLRNINTEYFKDDCDVYYHKTKGTSIYKYQYIIKEDKLNEG